MPLKIRMTAAAQVQGHLVRRIGEGLVVDRRFGAAAVPEYKGIGRAGRQFPEVSGGEGMGIDQHVLNSAGLAGDDRAVQHVGVAVFKDEPAGTAGIEHLRVNRELTQVGPHGVITIVYHGNGGHEPQFIRRVDRIELDAVEIEIIGSLRGQAAGDMQGTGDDALFAI